MTSGVRGYTGNGISNITKTGTSGLIDTYTITYTDGNTTTFTVSNGKGISSIVKTGSAGLIDTYRITYNDGTYFDYTVTNGQDGEVTEEELQDVYEQMSSELEDGTGTGTSIDTSDSAYWKAGIDLSGNTTQATSILPTEYQQVEYIESTGTQYIDTTAKLSQIYGYDIDFESTEFIDNNFNLNGIFGTNNVGEDLKIWFANNTNGARNSTSYKGSSIAPSYVPLETYLTRHNIKVINNNCYYDNTLIGTYSNPSEIVNDVNPYIFAMNEGIDVKFYSKTKLYHLKIYGNNNVLVRDFIPCYRKSDNEIGLYDLVNNVFHTNAGTGTFTKGSNISLPNPDYPQDIQVVKGSNNVKVQNKNLCKINGYNQASTMNGLTISYSNNKLLINGTCTARTDLYVTCFNSDFALLKDYINKNPDTYYGYTNKNNVRVTFYNDSNYRGGYTENSIPVSANVIYGTFFILIPKDTVFNNEYLDVIIEKGQKTSYVAHQEQNYTITLPEGMELVEIPNTNYIDEIDVVNKKIIKKTQKIASYNGETITTDYISTTGGLDVGATIYYGISPVETTITDTTLINQLNDIEKKLKTYQGITHITQTNEDMPFILTLDYKKSNLLRIKALENA